MMVRLVLLGLVAALPAAAQTGPSSGPSFDCARAQAWDERAICADRELSALDRRIAAAWARATANLGAEERARMQADQRSWLATRRACERPASGSPAACLRANLTARATMLETGGTASPSGGASAAAGKPVAAPAAPSPPQPAALQPVECGRDASWVARQICAQPALRQLDEAIVREAGVLRARFATRPAELQRVEDRLARYLRDRRACEHPPGRVPEDCLIETLEETREVLRTSFPAR